MKQITVNTTFESLSDMLVVFEGSTNGRKWYRLGVDRSAEWLDEESAAVLEAEGVRVVHCKPKV